MVAVRPSASITLGGIPLEVVELRQGGTDGQPEPYTDWTYRTLTGGCFYSQAGYPNTASYAVNAITRIPGVIMPRGVDNLVTLPASVNQPIGASFEYGGNLYFLAGRKALLVPSGTGTPLVVADFGAQQADSACVYMGVPYIGFPTGRMWKLVGAEFRQFEAEVSGSMLTDVQWLHGGIPFQHLVRKSSASGIRHIYEGQNVEDPDLWSNEVTVGNSTYPIQSIASTGTRVLIAKSNGVHFVNWAEHSVNLTPHWEDRATTENGAAMKWFQGSLYATHINGVELVHAAAWEQPAAGPVGLCGPGAPLPNESPVFGGVTAFGSDADWGLASVWNGSGDSYLCPFRDRAGLAAAHGEVPGVGPVVWHGGELWLEDEKITHLRTVIRGGIPKLWVASVTLGGTVRLRTVDVARSGNALHDYATQGPMRFHDSCSVYFPVIRQALSTTLVELTAQSDNLGNGTGFTLQASFDSARASVADVAWTSLGQAMRSPLDTLLPTSDVGSAGQTVAFRVDGFGTPTTPPVLRELNARARLKLETREVRYYRVRLSGERTRQGARDERDHQALWEDLKALWDGRRTTLEDELGQTCTVLLDQRPSSTLRFDAKTGQPEMMADLPLVVLAEESRLPAHWTTGSLYGGGRRYR